MTSKCVYLSSLLSVLKTIESNKTVFVTALLDKCHQLIAQMVKYNHQVLVPVRHNLNYQ